MMKEKYGILTAESRQQLVEQMDVAVKEGWIILGTPHSQFTWWRGMVRRGDPHAVVDRVEEPGLDLGL